jgi:hypothetical protein
LCFQLLALILLHTRLSAAIFSAVYNGLFDGTEASVQQHVSGFFFFVAVVSTVTNAVGILVLTPPSSPSTGTKMALAIEGGGGGSEEYAAKGGYEERGADNNGTSVGKSGYLDNVPASLLRADYWGLFIFFTVIQANGEISSPPVEANSPLTRLPIRLKVSSLSPTSALSPIAWRSTARARGQSM